MTMAELPEYPVDEVTTEFHKTFCKLDHIEQCGFGWPVQVWERMRWEARAHHFMESIAAAADASGMTPEAFTIELLGLIREANKVKGPSFDVARAWRKKTDAGS